MQCLPFFCWQLLCYIHNISTSDCPDLSENRWDSKTLLESGGTWHLGVGTRLRSVETHVPVHCTFINLMKELNERPLIFFGTSIKPFHVLMSFL